MSMSPDLFHSSVDQSQTGHTDKQCIVDNSSNPTCTQCIYPQRIQGGRSSSLYSSHTEHLGLQWGYSHRAEKKKNKKKIAVVHLKTNRQKKHTRTKTSHIFQVLIEFLHYELPLSKDNMWIIKIGIYLYSTRVKQLH